jgi:hypothetical protein
MKWDTEFVLRGGVTMTKKFLWVLIIIVFTPCIAFAEKDVRLELEGRFWFTDLEGRVRVTDADEGTDINLKKDLDIKDEGYPEVRLTWYTGKKSKIRIAYTQVGYDGEANIERTILFDGTTYNAGTRVVTDFDLKYLRIGWAWQFINIDGGLIKLGTLIEGKGFWSKTRLEAPDLVPALREKVRVIFALPTIGAALDINPHKMLNIFAEGSGLSAGKYGYMYDVEAGIKLIPVKILSIMGGYRLLEFKAKDDRDFAKARVHGPFVGVTVRF